MSFQMPVIPPTVTSRAFARLQEIGAADQGKVLRVAVAGGGCSGFQYAFDIAQTQGADDIVVERDGATVLVDQVSLPFLEGSTIDFVDDLIGQSFKIENPQATAGCGCGTSFSI